MFIFFILGLLIGGVAVVFALQNTDVITVTFITWQITGSMALVLIVAVAAGFLISALFSMPGLIRSKLTIMSLRKQNKKMEEDLIAAKKLISSGSVKSDSVYMEKNITVETK